MLRRRASLAASDFESTVAGDLLAAAGMPPDATPNCLLAVLWASLANTVRVAACILQLTHAPKHHLWSQGDSTACQADQVCTALLWQSEGVTERKEGEAFIRHPAVDCCAGPRGILGGRILAAAGERGASRSGGA